ncbi:hypothetical protein RHMOL_Rhmol02G0241500 [Rhododendron molle]|uniref:Uncharacterized protein n=1 Tax=Rhododendron molle TaxID=49168 RepID=A0ACC0PTZ3_RHOML|nr:hypothetical protein RHMOL_Rhmol02G0241500 [Rhododendron molle]
MATPNGSHEIELAATTPNGRREIATPQTNPNAGNELNWKKLSEYDTIVQNLSGRIISLQKSAFTLANYYFVSQAVVFTALSSNSSLVCRDVWFPLFLSLLPGALNLFAFFKIGQEYIETMISQEEYKQLRADHQVVMSGQIPDRTQDPNAENTRIVKKEKNERLLYRCMYAFGFLAVVVAVGSLWMLCGESIIVKHNTKCVKLCI